MIDSSIRETLASVRDGHLLVLTGAGISAESGVPTFRGKDGYWTVGSRVYHPQEMATQSAFRRMPDAVWAWYLHRRSICRAAPPNPGHHALVTLEKRFLDRFCLVTQNVDGLHLRSGNTMARTLQIHGNIDFMRCSHGCCPTLVEIPLPLAETPGAALPAPSERLRCEACGGPSRPHVLWFDEYYDEPLFRAQSALDAAARADLLVVVGTAGATNLPMQIASVAGRRKTPIIDVNVEDNPFAALAIASGRGHAIRGRASTVVPELVKLLAN